MACVVMVTVEDEEDGGGSVLEESASWSLSPPQAGAGIMHQELDLGQTRRLIRVPAAHQRGLTFGGGWVWGGRVAAFGE